MSSKNIAKVEHTAGGRPNSLYENITETTLAFIDDAFPTSNGRLRASDSRLETEFKAYEIRTTAVINSLIGKVNALTPVC